MADLWPRQRAPASTDLLKLELLKLLQLLLLLLCALLILFLLLDLVKSWHGHLTNYVNIFTD